MVLPHGVLETIIPAIKAVIADVMMRTSAISQEIISTVSRIVKMFNAGAEILLKIIIKRFYIKLNLKFKDVEGWSFIDYVENAKKSIKEG